MEICKKIDVHAHAILNAQYEFTKYIEVTPEDIFRIYDELNIERGVLMPILSPEGTTVVMPNGNTCALAKAYPERFFWFCNLDPRMYPYRTDTDFSEALEFYKKLGAKGVGELTSNLYADDPLMDNLFSHCAACDMPVTIHVAPTIAGYYGIADEVGLPRLQKMLKKHPNLRIIGHSQPFWAEISGDCCEANRFDYPTGKITEGNLARILRECENLYMDLSAYSCCNALMRDEDYAYRFIEEFADRMMFAIDYCHHENRHTYKLAKWLDESAAKGCISEENYRKICRENAIRILKLEL